MSGYAYGDHEPVESCPYCSTPCRADFVDIGVGFQQCGPYHCDECGASEIGPHDAERQLTDEERSKGWYAPGEPPGSSANVIGGRVISHVQMKAAYEAEFRGNPLWHVPGEVDRWREEVRSVGVRKARGGAMTAERISAERRAFPIMASYRLEENVNKLRAAGVPFLVVSMPWDMLTPHERQAQQNHSQTLKRLAERGGLSACEALAILDDRKWQRMDFAQANAELARRVAAAALQQTPPAGVGSAVPTGSD